MTRTRFFYLASTAIAVALIAATLSAGAVVNRRPSGGRAVAHRDSREVASSKAPNVETYSIGGHALEPTLGIGPDGAIYYAAAGFDSVGGQAGTQVLRSTNRGESWKNTSPRVLGQNAMPLSLDPYIYVDETAGKAGRVFSIDLTLACAYMSFSDDRGASWTTNPLSCGRPVNDHQTLFGGPPVSTPTVNYPNILYYCWNDVASSECSKSIDGGLTFTPTGAPAFSGYEQGSQDPGFYGVDGFCGGLHGHGAVGPEGNVYLPREYCGKPMLAISSDEGRTWTQVKVSDIRSTSQPTGGAGHPSVTTDRKGNLYYMWIAADNRMPYLSTSTDQGKTWSDPVAMAIPGLTEANIPQIDAVGVGKIAFVYYGSTDSRFQKCKDKCQSKDYAKTTWGAYIGLSANALSKDPLFYTGQVNDPKDPLIRGRCGPGRCQDVYDFIDVEIGRDGVPYGAFVDGCMPGCTEATPTASDYEGLVAKLLGGPSLR